MFVFKYQSLNLLHVNVHIIPHALAIATSAKSLFIKTCVIHQVEKNLFACSYKQYKAATYLHLV